MARRAALGLLAALLPLTLGLRAANAGERMIDVDRLSADTIRLAGSQGWTARPFRHHFLGPLVEARRGSCRILIHFAPPEGPTEGKFASLASSFGPVEYHYRGATTATLPRHGPLLAWHAQRYAWSFGLAVPTAPLVALARSRECGAMAPDLTPLAQHLTDVVPPAG